VTESVPEESFVTSAMGGLPVVTPPLAVDVTNAEQFQQALASANDDQPIMVVDMTTNEFCDSSALGVLVAALKRARASGGEIRLVMGDSSAHRIFKLTGVDRIFRIFGTVAEAAAAKPLELSAGNSAQAGHLSGQRPPGSS
jgi:anti-sigma B factor antagonist